jgi:hypothetical protein
LVERPSLRKFAPILVDALEAADHAALEVELDGDAQVEVAISAL